MNHIISKMLMYGSMPEESILMQLAKIFNEYSILKTEIQEKSIDEKNAEIKKDRLRTSIYREVKRLLITATDYGFDTNLWHNYLTFVIMKIGRAHV